MTVTFKTTLPNKPHIIEYEMPNQQKLASLGVAHSYLRSFGQKIYVLAPRLDQVTILLDIKDEDDQQEYVKGVWGWAADDGFEGISVIQKGEKGWPAVKNTSYDINIRIDDTETPFFTILQLKPKNASHAFLRLRIPVAKLGPSGVSRLKEQLALYLGEDTWQQILTKGKVSNYHVATDIIGGSLGEFLFFLSSTGKTKSKAYFGADKCIETHYLNQTGSAYVYNKKQEANDHKLAPEFGTNVAHTRVEFRRTINNEKIGLFGLLKANNPFGKLQVIDCNKICPVNLQPHLWLWFCGTARHQGINKALSFSEDECLNSVIRTNLKACQDNVFPGQKIWSSWKQSISASGLLGPN